MLRTMMRPILWTAAGVLLALPAPAADTTGEDISITDPALLERLGFEPDAANVYATRRAYEQLLMSPEERAALQEVQLADRLAAQESTSTAGPYGVNRAGFSTIDPSMFRPVDGSTDFRVGLFGMVCDSGFATFDGQFFDLPHGARLEWIDFWTYDASAEQLSGSAWEACQSDFGPGTPSVTLLGEINTIGAGGDGFYSIFTGNRPVDVESCTYRVSVSLDDGDNCSERFDLRIQKARAQWLRQVSPAPTTATFGDVPTSHLFFQHIEALAASGITGGGGGGDFCPNDPLTRGQMAAFLAKAPRPWGCTGEISPRTERSVDERPKVPATCDGHRTPGRARGPVDGVLQHAPRTDREPGDPDSPGFTSTGMKTHRPREESRCDTNRRTTGLARNHRTSQGDFPCTAETGFCSRCSARSS